MASGTADGEKKERARESQRASEREGRVGTRWGENERGEEDVLLGHSSWNLVGMNRAESQNVWEFRALGCSDAR